MRCATHKKEIVVNIIKQEITISTWDKPHKIFIPLPGKKEYKKISVLADIKPTPTAVAVYNYSGSLPNNEHVYEFDYVEIRK